MKKTALIIAGNWKMNLTLGESNELVKQLLQGLPKLNGVQVIVAPPFTALQAAALELKGSSMELAAQDLHWEKPGAFTGAIAGEQLADIGCRYVLIGHSERRQYFGETNSIVGKKIQAAFRVGLKPIVCVGETVQERESQKTFSVIQTQIQQAFVSLRSKQIEELFIAYEPIWAIGTGKVASPEMAQEVHQFIRDQIKTSKTPILYGGSVNPENARGLFAQPDIDGALVGGASLKAQSFLSIIGSAISVLKENG
ncbi:MAG: triose-phosphate isomerase [Deltaproteobacteria bacterium]|nr:triose-phosphate isomerase [Deltaproteobacteria bacterium]